MADKEFILPIQGHHTAAEIAAINDQIARGVVEYPSSQEIVLRADGQSTRGTPYRLVGSGISAQFKPLTVGEGVNYTAIRTPTGFRWSTYPFILYRQSGKIVTDYDITDGHIPADDTGTWFVDPVNGNDGTAVLGNRALPLKLFSVAILKTTGTTIEIINLTADFFGRTTATWNNLMPTKAWNILNRTGFRFVHLKTASSVPPTFTVNGTYSKVYQALSTTLNSGAVVDISKKSYPAGPLLPPAWLNLKLVTSIAEVAATAGTWYNDGTNTYIRASDDRNLIGDTSMTLLSNANNGRFPETLNDITIYMQGMDFLGGLPFRMIFASTVTGCVLKHNNCSFQSSVSANNGLSVASFSSCIGYRSAAYYNWADGFNYHSFESDGVTTGTSPNFVEIECGAIGNGTTGSAAVSDNASTAHDFVNGIRVNCSYLNSSDRVMVDTNSAYTWALGVTVGQAVTVGAGVQNIAALINARMWLDTVTATAGANPRWCAAQQSRLSYYNSGDVVNDVTGESTGTVIAIPA